jgi:hypothetical protein
LLVGELKGCCRPIAPDCIIRFRQLPTVGVNLYVTLAAIDTNLAPLERFDRWAMARIIVIICLIGIFARLAGIHGGCLAGRVAPCGFSFSCPSALIVYVAPII